jgi:hypothetical protein
VKELARLGFITKKELSLPETMVVLDSLSKLKESPEEQRATVKALLDMLFHDKN